MNYRGHGELARRIRPELPRFAEGGFPRLVQEVSSTTFVVLHLAPQKNILR